LPMVPVDSSAANMPLLLATIARAVLANSLRLELVLILTLRRTLKGLAKAGNFTVFEVQKPREKTAPTR